MAVDYAIDCSAGFDFLGADVVMPMLSLISARGVAIT